MQFGIVLYYIFVNKFDNMNLKLLFIILFSTSVLMTQAAEGDGINAKTPVVLGQNYPNPAKNKTVINVEFASTEAVLRIYNVLGKLVEEIVVSSDQKRITLDVSNYQEGIYLYSIEADGQKVTKRMTVNK